jgi:hypothetical protein
LGGILTYFSAFAAFCQDLAALFKNEINCLQQYGYLDAVFSPDSPTRNSMAQAGTLVLAYQTRRFPLRECQVFV